MGLITVSTSLIWLQAILVSRRPTKPCLYLFIQSFIALYVVQPVRPHIFQQPIIK
jgi:hypothetical protein